MNKYNLIYLNFGLLRNSSFPILEAATRGILVKKVFLKISQNSQENTCARISFLIKKKKALAQVFSCEFYEIFKNIFFREHLRTTASTIYHIVHSFFVLSFSKDYLHIHFDSSNFFSQATGCVLQKKVFLKNSQISQENTCVGISF